MENENFYLKIENNIPVNHPVLESNLRMFYPDLDPSDPPEGWAKFIRSEVPTIQPNEIIEGVSYEISNYLTDLYKTKTYTDIYNIREITSSDKAVMIEQYKQMNPEQSDWVFDEATDTLIPPIPKPTDGEEYVWMLPNKTIGETEGRWINKKEVVSASKEEFDAMFQAMKELQLEINNSSSANVSSNTVQELIDDIKKSTEIEEPIS